MKNVGNGFGRAALAGSFALAALFAGGLPGATTPNAPADDASETTPGSKTGDPVGIADGNVYVSAVDLALPCPGVDLVLKRAYGSWSTRTGPLGYGWSHSLDWRLEEKGTNLVLYADADPEAAGTGETHRFARPAEGASSLSPSGGFVLRRRGGVYEVQTPGALVCRFDASGALERIETPDGTGIGLERAAGGRLSRAVHDCGQSLSFSYGANGLLASVGTADPEVRVDYEYGDQAGTYPATLLVRAIRRDHGRASTNGYAWCALPEAGTSHAGTGRAVARAAKTAAGPLPTGCLPDWYRRPVLSSRTDANGVETWYEYERPDDGPSVRCTHSRMTGGLFDTRLSHLGGAVVVRRPAAGRTIVETHVFDARAKEVRVSIGDEEVRRGYDADGNAVLEIATNAATGAFLVRTAAYDGMRNAVREGRALGRPPSRPTVRSWDALRRVPRRVETPEGRVREWTADGGGMTVYGAGTNDARLVARVLRRADGLPYEVGLPGGGRVGLSYDAAGRLSGVAASGLPSASFAYDALGRVASDVRPGPEGARTTSYVRNARGRPLSVVHADGTSESFAYDGNGTRVVGHVDALGREDVFAWTLGLPIRAGRVIGGVTNALFAVFHDPQLNVVSIRDPLGRPAESYVLDGSERIVAVTNLEGQVLSRRYLVGDLASSETRFDGSRVSYGYDSSANLASVAYPDDTLRFTHDNDGLLTSASNAAGTVTNAYDSATGWLDSSTGADGTLVSYLHSDGGSVTAVVSVAGTTRHALDAAGRRTRTDSSAGTVGYGYCSWNGLVAAVTNANGVVASYEYDIMDRVTNVTWRTASGMRLGGFEYAYDALGRIVSRTHEFGTNRFDRVYAYDDLDRLASDGPVSYAYDAVGNRTTRAEDGETIAYTLGQGDRLAAWTGGSYAYDAAGCVTRIVRGSNTWDLAWNGQYQLVSVSTNGVLAESYAYDALGRRVTTTNAEGTEHHVYDDGWQVLADVDGDGNVVRSYEWAEGIDRLVSVKIGSHVYTALTDVQGTVWGYADGSGAVVARWTYDAWGNVLSEEIASSAAELLSVRYRFQGRERSAATGLTNFRMRWYDAATGRWLSKDPIGLGGGLNLYVSCENDPICRIDPRGEGWVAVVVGCTIAAYGIYQFFKFVISVKHKMENRDINDLCDITQGAIDVSSEMMSKISSPTGMTPDKPSPLVDPIIEPVTKWIWDKIFNRIRPTK